MIKKIRVSSAKITAPLILVILALSSCSGSNDGSSESVPLNQNPLNTDPLPFEQENNAPFAQAYVQSANFNSNLLHYSGDAITLLGSNSNDFDGTIVSYDWIQLSGSTQIVLSSPDEADTSFIAPVSLVAQTYVFQLTVIDDEDATDTATVDVTVNPRVNCSSCTTNQINILHESDSVTGERYGQLAAIEDAMLAIPNQTLNTIEFHDLNTGEILNKVQLNSAPDQLYYQPARRLLYVSLIGTTAISVINIDTDQIQTFQISGPVESMTGGNDRVYYSLQTQFLNNVLFSIDSDGIEQSHGAIEENLIAYNANLNEIINANSEGSGGGLHRYRFNESGQLEQIQTADAESAGFFGPVPYAFNISISSDYQQMAIASSGDQTSAGYPILDIPPGNVQISNGAWLSDSPAEWVEFSPTDEHIVILSDSFELGASVATIYNATTKVKLLDKVLPLCAEGYQIPVQAGFTNDNRYFYTKIDCGFDSNETIIDYTKFPRF